jgi:hypothetical protein
VLAESLKEKEIEEVKRQWQSLWLECFNDKVRAEGISIKDYVSLFVDKGLVVFATRNFKALDLKEILCRHGFGNVDRVVPPDPNVGGWGKFVRSCLVRQERYSRVKQVREEMEKDRKKQQLKKGGRGWLHV